MNDKKSDDKKDSEDKIANIPVCRKCGVTLTDENWYASYKKHPIISARNVKLNVLRNGIRIIKKNIINQ
jgi:hypothetical protein